MRMRGADLMDVKQPGREPHVGSRFGRGRPFATQCHVTPAFLVRVPQGSLCWIFVKRDMPAQWQPLGQRPMVDEEHFCPLHHTNGDSAIECFRAEVAWVACVTALAVP